MRCSCMRCGVVFTFLFLASSAVNASETKLHYGRFGTVTLYQQSARPSQVVLFVSGDGGWNLGVVDMARELSTLDALVVGIDITHYLKEMESSPEKCSYPAADFEMLSKFVQKKLGFPRYVMPVLIGYSSGATLVYAILAQSPPQYLSGSLQPRVLSRSAFEKTDVQGKRSGMEGGTAWKGLQFPPREKPPVAMDRFSG